MSTRKERLAKIEKLVSEHGPIYAIGTLHRERCFMMEQRKRCDLALGAYLRRCEGWHKDKPEAERKEIAGRVSAMLNDGVPEDSPYFKVIFASEQGKKAFEDQEAEATYCMEKIAEMLPVWSAWGDGVRAFGARSLAVIIGEAGDLSGYATHSKLWKRMGLAVMDGIRQGGLKKTASSDDWIAHGYNAKRRSQMYVIGDTMIKQGEFYRQVYLDRKEYERERATASGLIVAPSAKIPKGKEAQYISDGHIHKRAQRYMEKKLLRDLWNEWRKASATMPEEATLALPSAEPFKAAA